MWYVPVHYHNQNYMKSFNIFTEYIQRAMDFYRSLFKHPLFIIVSDDIEWCKKNIKKTNNVFFPHGGQAEDFAILVSCNHSVITSGSFSWWAGWLAGGRVVYYSGYPTPGTEIGRMYNRTDYYPPTWIPMNWIKYTPASQIDCIIRNILQVMNIHEQ